ncbi:MAG TPA: aldehyde dehydrogenase family protein, partial [Pseudonocardia sp.]
MKTVGHWIGGKYVDGDSGRTAPVTDPATGEVTAEVALASVADVDLAVAAASEAAADWTRSSLSTRTRVLFRYRELLDRRRDEIASLITAEHGKVHADALGEVARGIEVVEFACSIPQLLKS